MFYFMALPMSFSYDTHQNNFSDLETEKEVEHANEQVFNLANNSLSITSKVSSRNFTNDPSLHKGTLCKL